MWIVSWLYRLMRKLRIRKDSTGHREGSGWKIIHGKPHDRRMAADHEGFDVDDEQKRGRRMGGRRGASFLEGDVSSQLNIR
jgi:hypothetical protein